MFVYVPEVTEYQNLFVQQNIYRDAEFHVLLRIALSPKLRGYNYVVRAIHRDHSWAKDNGYLYNSGVCTISKLLHPRAPYNTRKMDLMEFEIMRIGGDLVRNCPSQGELIRQRFIDTLCDVVLADSFFRLR